MLAEDDPNNGFPEFHAFNRLFELVRDVGELAFFEITFQELHANGIGH